MPKTELADHLGISRQTLYQILHETRAVTADVAAGLGRAFGNNPVFWLNLQACRAETRDPQDFTFTQGC
jgi:addiction module HigA family antidote